MKRVIGLAVISVLVLGCSSNSGDGASAGDPGGSSSEGVKLFAEDSAVPEGSATDSGVLSFDLHLSEPAPQSLSVTWSTEDASAEAGSDYQAAQGSAVFAVGERSKQISINLIGDDADEGAETLMVNLSSHDLDLNIRQLTGTIANDDAACEPNLPGDENPWLADDRVMINFSHRGGALEFPENTLYSYKKSLDVGADVLEMDVYETADGELVVIHDATVDRTTERVGNVNEFTVAELKAMDAAYRFVPDRGAVFDDDEAEYLFRGIATGDVEPPLGFTANDFTIPTLEEILMAFPNTLINIELKPDTQNQGSYEQKLAALLQAYGRKDDVIVASFIDLPAALFKAQAPCVSTSYPTGQAAAAVALSQGPGVIVNSGLHHSFQVPPTLGLEVVTEDFVNDAHAADLAVHVWTINSCEEMVRLLEMGVDAIMTDRPALLSQLLAQDAGQWSCDAL